MQNNKNHMRFNPLHHFLLIPLTMLLFVWSIIKLVNAQEDISTAIYFLIFSFALLISSFILRFYATKNQDRTIRLEMRLRYFQITGKSFQKKEQQLSLSQIIALRFASDDELIELIERSIDEKLPAKEIKNSIKTWTPDHMRV